MNEDELRALLDELLAALKDMTARFHRCAVRMGCDPEFADVAVSGARAAIAKAETRGRRLPADGLLTTCGTQDPADHV